MTQFTQCKAPTGPCRMASSTSRGRATQGSHLPTSSEGNSLEGGERPVLLHRQSNGLAAFIVQQVGC